MLQSEPFPLAHAVQYTDTGYLILVMHIQFVVTPFLPRSIPPLGISSLISLVRAAGYRASVHYLNLALAKHSGSDLSLFAEQFFESDTLVGGSSLLLPYGVRPQFPG